MTFGDPILEPRFWAKVRVDPSTLCWVWTGSRSNIGYGNYWIGTRCFKAHRVAYEAAKSWIPDGLEIDHLCRVRYCVNPDHLEAVTREENMRRQFHWDVGSLHRDKTHCPQGHPYNEANTYVSPTSGKRFCRVCGRERARAKYRRGLGP